MKKLLGIGLTCLSVLGFASIFNVNAAAEVTEPTKFTELQTGSKLKFTYDTETFNPSNVQIKFGGKVTKDVEGYDNLDYQYGVAIIPYDENSEKTIVGYDMATLKDKAKEGYALNCKITERTPEGFDYSWVITNTKADMKYTASMYRYDTTNPDTTLEIAKPVSRTVKETANLYIKSGVTELLTHQVRTSLAKIEGISNSITLTEEMLKNNMDTKFEVFPNLNDVDLYAYVWGVGFAAYTTKISNLTMELNPYMNGVIFFMVQKDSTEIGFEAPANPWYVSRKLNYVNGTFEEVNHYVRVDWPLVNDNFDSSFNNNYYDSGRTIYLHAWSTNAKISDLWIEADPSKAQILEINNIYDEFQIVIKEGANKKPGDNTNYSKTFDLKISDKEIAGKKAIRVEKATLEKALSDSWQLNTNNDDFTAILYQGETELSRDVLQVINTGDLFYFFDAEKLAQADSIVIHGHRKGIPDATQGDGHWGNTNKMKVVDGQIIWEIKK